MKGRGGGPRFSIRTMDTEGEDGEERRKCSVKSVRFSMGRRSRSRSEGSKRQYTVKGARMELPSTVRIDILTKRLSRSTLTGVTKETNSGLKMVVGRPTFKRQDTDIGVLAEARKGSASVVVGDALRVLS